MRESRQVDTVQRAGGASHFDFELRDEVGEDGGEVGEIFVGDEGEDFCGAVAERVAAVAVADDFVVFGYGGFGGDEGVAGGGDAGADLGVVEGDLGGGGGGEVRCGSGGGGGCGADWGVLFWFR